MFQFLYGPPGSGKTTLGKELADRLDLAFTDLDEVIEQQAGMQIPQIFQLEGEAGFRVRESQALSAVLLDGRGVIALGGGALLNASNRTLVERNGQVICLRAPFETLLNRLRSAQTTRPLLEDRPAPASEGMNGMAQRLQGLLGARQSHYDSFPLQLETGHASLEQLVHAAHQILGAFRVSGMGADYDVRVVSGGIRTLGSLLQGRKLNGPIALVSDQNVGDFYAQQVKQTLESAGYEVNVILIPPGEAFKTITTVNSLWKQFLEAGVERRSTVVALGGGVVSDLAGFAAATYLRGVPWVAVPTSLLGMVDASLGGKTGADLPEGKNLIGAFYPPRLVLVDPETLNTLPEEERNSGMAEVVKAGIIGDGELYSLSKLGWESIEAHWDEIIRRAMAVKIGVIQEDPYEKGRRASLNLGHTVGHAVEKVSSYQIRHGEAVAIGMVVEAQLGEAIGITEKGLADEIASVLSALNLPVSLPGGLDRQAMLRVMRVDKKKAAGQVYFAIPERIGTVCTGVHIPDLEAIFVDL